MTYKLKAIVMVVAFCAAINVCFCATEVNAVKCKDVTMNVNPSLYTACNGTGADGAMWISSSSDTSSIDATVDYNGTNNVINVYMHGVVIDNDGDENDKQPATCIKIFTTSPEHPKLSTDKPLSAGGTMTCSNASVYDGDDYKFTPLDISNLLENDYGRYLNRSLVMRGERNNNGSLTYDNADDIISTSAKISLDVSRAIEGKTCTKRADKSACDYNISVNFFRCFYGLEASSGYCYSDISTIKLSVRVPGFFVGTSVAMTQKNAGLDNCRLGINGCRVVDYDAVHRWKPESGSAVREYTVGDTLILPDCDPVSGCEVTFRHYLKRTDGSGEAKYVIYREGSSNSNTGVLTTSGLAIDSALKVRKDEWDTITMYPGQKVCERLEFRADGKSPVDYPNGKTTSRVCAVAVGGTESSIDAKIRNATSGSLYGNWSNGPVYAKPGDHVMVRGTLIPKVQAWYEKTIFGIDGTIGANFNRDNEPDWQNAFSIKVGYGGLVDGVSCAKTVFGDKSSSDSSDLVGDYDRVVTMSDVGETIAMQAMTNCNNGGRNTPKRVDVVYDDRGEGNGEFSGEVNIDPLRSNNMEVRIPYNFVNTPVMESSDNQVFAGENSKVSYTIITDKKPNTLVGGDPYATIVKGAKWKVGFCTDGMDVGSCRWSEPTTGDLHAGVDVEMQDQYMLVQDLPAGTKIYARAAVYPAESSDSETGWADPEGNHEWAYSRPMEIPVSKKPSFQVWGGDIFVKDGVDVDDIPLANKIVLATSFEEHAPRKFGSWGELSVETGSGSTGNLFSGAALGFAGNNEGKLSPNYSFPLEGGSTSGYQGPGNNSSGINPGGSNSSGGDLNYSGGSGIIIDEFVNKISKKIGNDDKKEVGGDSKIGDLESEDLNFGPNAKKMYVSDGDIIINKDIMYSGEYETLESIPKIVIYADNIKIDCSVERIDAVLIAKRNIQTCDNIYTDSAKASVQLRINGAMIAGETVKFKRNYGAGTGANSMIPAEIINMDPSWYLWAGEVMETSGADEANEDSGLMMPTYVNELPPRY